MDVTINNLYFKYDENSHCICAYDTITNSFVSYIHVNNNQTMDKNSFENECNRWATASYDNSDRLYSGVDYNIWY